MTLLEHLENYNNKKVTPLHMPGHKRNIKFAEYLEKLGAEYDFTEIYSMDDLHEPQGIIKACQQNAQIVWGSKHSYFLVNGSTGGILAGIRACTKSNDKVLVARNCHKSIYNAIELCNLTPKYILPNLLENLPSYSSVNPQTVYNALKESFSKGEKISLVILTSPTYEGVISDIKSIAEIAHSFGVPVLVDEAHGSHLDISEFFTGGAVKGGADIVVQSLHKTLPSLTQTALIHLNSNIIKPEQLQRQLSIFQTSSPSYLLMSSIDSCIRFIQKNKECFSSWNDNLLYFKNKVSSLKNLSILSYTVSDKFYAFDNSKIVISTVGTSINGSQIMDILRTQYNIELEMCSADYVIAMTSVADTKENLEVLANALIEIDKSIFKFNREILFTTISELPPVSTNILESIYCETEEVEISCSIGKISAEYVWVYPPGIPIITPGEIITENTINVINTATECNLNLQKTSSDNPNKISVIV
ncbi:MAG: aminotransferase class I/II-fold pyridoxal phosphate-dependent enzyme [Acutalibacteraceae bacterium]|nr:aminotransferase class I/II-fold pyridoxal phosphate-dependent enzyme [Acutalibacteraceae bacterium]